MYKRILVALDGSQLSEGILPYARFFAETLKVPVELLRVIGPEALTPLSDAQHARYDDVMTAERKTAEVYLKGVAASFPDPSAVDGTVEIGKPETIIGDRAEAHADTLIAMATHGRSGVGRWLLGSVADKVLHATASHLLLVRTTEKSEGSEAAPFKAVVVSLDGSGLAEMVMPHVAELAKKVDLEVILLRVCALPIPVYTAQEYMPDLGELWDQMKKEAKEYLEEKVRQLQQQGLRRVSSMAVEGEAAEKIISLARKKSPSLVAMCTHGRTGIDRWVLGSVTERVVRHLSEPVLVIRALTDSAPSAP